VAAMAASQSLSVRTTRRGYPAARESRSGLYVFAAVKKARNLLFEFNGRKRIAERSSTCKKLPLDLHGQLVPAYNHRRHQIMQNVRFVLD